MQAHLLFFFFLVLATTEISAQNAPTGRWETLDEETGQASSIIEIYEQKGKYYGKIAEILTENKDAICTECSGKQKDAPLLGMVIIKGLEKDDDEWNGGTIFDPQKGAEYRLSAWFDGDPNKLYIRGKHWTGLYRTQTWQRAK